MSRTLTASDRASLIRLASKMPLGSEGRRAILAGLSLRSPVVPGLHIAEPKILEPNGTPIRRAELSPGPISYTIVVALQGDYNGQRFSQNLTYVMKNHYHNSDWVYKIVLPDPNKVTTEISEGPLSKDDIEMNLVEGWWDVLLPKLIDVIEETFNTSDLDYFSHVYIVL